MSTERPSVRTSLRWTFKSWGRVWIAPAVLALLLLGFFATGLAAFDRPAVRVVAVGLVVVVIIALRTIRRLSVDDLGVLRLEAPARKLTVPARDVVYLAPAFDRDYLEFGFTRGRCKIIDDFGDIDAIEAAIRQFNSAFRGRVDSGA